MGVEGDLMSLYCKSSPAPELRVRIGALQLSLVLKRLGVSVKVSLCVKMVLAGHWVVQPKMLHAHCLGNISF